MHGRSFGSAFFVSGSRRRRGGAAPAPERERAVEATDFDIHAPGHGPLGTPADATAFRAYRVDPWAAGGDAVKA